MEYGLLAVLIAAVIVVAVIALGRVTAGGMDAPCKALGDAGAPSSCR